MDRLMGIRKEQFIGFFVFVLIGQITAYIIWLWIDKNYALLIFVVSILLYLLVGQIIKRTSN